MDARSPSRFGRFRANCSAHRFRAWRPVSLARPSRDMNGRLRSELPATLEIGDELPDCERTASLVTSDKVRFSIAAVPTRNGPARDPGRFSWPTIGASRFHALTDSWLDGVRPRTARSSERTLILFWGETAAARRRHQARLDDVPLLAAPQWRVIGCPPTIRSGRARELVVTDRVAV